MFMIFWIIFEFGHGDRFAHIDRSEAIVDELNEALIETIISKQDQQRTDSQQASTVRNTNVLIKTRRSFYRNTISSTPHKASIPSQSSALNNG